MCRVRSIYFASINRLILLHLINQQDYSVVADLVSFSAYCALPRHYSELAWEENEVAGFDALKERCMQIVWNGFVFLNKNRTKLHK